MLLPLTAEDPNNKTFRYEGHDIITLQKIVEREYKVPEPQTSQELISYYAQKIAKAVNLPSQFSLLAPKVKDFFENKAFGRWVDLEKRVTVRAMATPVAAYVYRNSPKRSEAIKHRRTGTAIAWSAANAFKLPAVSVVREKYAHEADHCVLNMVPCDNEFELASPSSWMTPGRSRILKAPTAVRIFDRLH